MRRALSRLSSETFNLLIVGGGASGAFTARDAALRGLKVALVEARDFAGATSAHNSKLAHGMPPFRPPLHHNRLIKGLALSPLGVFQANPDG